MANTLTIEEAAQQLGLTVEKCKFTLKTRKDSNAVRPRMGGATMHFREQDVQELARKLGMGSDPGLQLGDASSDPIIPLGVKDDDQQVEIGREHPSSGSSSARLKSPSSKSLKAGQPSVESGTFVPVVSEEKGKGSDSDVKLAKGSDSNVRLERKGSAPAGTPTEEIDLDAERKKKGDSSSGKVFELADEGSKTGSGKKSDKKATAKKPINN